MEIQNVPFQTIDWARVKPTTHPGQAYVVSSGDGAHRSRSECGVRLLIVD